MIFGFFELDSEKLQHGMAHHMNPISKVEISAETFPKPICFWLNYYIFDTDVS